MRPFRYCAEPLCLAAIVVYALNRCCLAPLCGTAVPFLTRHFGDVLLLPAALPLLLWLQRLAGLRTHDFPPSWSEILGVLLLWALLFEGVFPRVLGLGVGDPLDVVAYAAGALVAGCVWTRQSALKRGFWPRKFCGLP